jgi:hypothetical protein
MVKSIRKSDKVLMSIIGIVVVLFSLSFVFADPTNLFGDTNVTTSSILEDLNLTVNISIFNTDGINITANISEVNITIGTFLYFANLTNASTSGTDSVFTNTSTVLSWKVDNLTTNQSREYFTFNVTAPTPGDYMINISTLNGTGVYNSSVTLTVNDTLSSSVAFGNVNTEVADAAFNRTFIYVNVTVNETQEDTITFELHNFTGGLLNRTVNTSSLARTYNWTAELGAGKYIYNVTVNDTFNTRTSVSRTISLDWAVPNVTASCDSATYTQGDSITCACSIVDDVDTAPNSSDSTYSTATIGTFVYSCSADDDVPYTGNSTFTYTVNAVQGTTTTTSGGGAVITKTYLVTEEDFQSGFTKQVAKNERIKFTKDYKAHTVVVNELTSSTVTVQIASTPQTATLQVGDLRKFDVTEDGYYDMTLKLNSIDNNKADLTVLSIHEMITPETIADADESEAAAGDVQDDETGVGEGSGSLVWLWILIGVVVVVVALILPRYLRKSKDDVVVKGKKKK